MAPPDKKQKTEEATEPAAVEAASAEAAPAAATVPEPPKVEEPPPELERDAGSVRDAMKEPVVFLPADTTLNVLPATTSGLLMSLTEGGLQGFIAGARASVGISKGRYLFEVKVVEITGQAVLRVGFSTAGSSLVLGGDKGGVGFDADGSTVVSGVRTQNKQRITRDCVVGVLLNLDAGSANKNTISLFKDGVRATQPVELPEDLLGKTLFPHVSFRGSAVYANFGPSAFAPLPFKCHMVQGASQAHCTVTKHKGGKNEVIFPVALPDEGTFDWLDTYKEKNPHLTELSDRMIVDWAQQSGLVHHVHTQSNDKPGALHKVADEAALRRAVYAIAPLNTRSYVVMEVRGNLLEDDRKELLEKFPDQLFKKVAMVVMGDPPTDFKKKTQQMTLARKQATSDQLFRTKQAEEKKKKLAEKKRKEMEKARKKAIKEAQKKAKEMMKKAEAEKKAKEAAAAAAKDGEAKEGEEAKEAKKEEEEKKEEKAAESEPEEESADEEEPEEMEVDEEPPQVELDADEKKVAFFQRVTKDLAPAALSSSFSKFALPAADEGFDEVTYLWAKESACKTYLKNYVLDKKLNLRVEELVPGAWSKKTAERWSQAVREWQMRQKVYEDKVTAKARAKAQKAAEKARQAAIKAAKEKADALKKEKEEAEAAAKKAAAEAAAAAGQPVPEEKKEEEKKEEEPKKEEDVEMKQEEEKKEEEESEAEEEPFDFAGLDVYGVDDVLDVGSGIPIFKEFKPADWAMMSLRFELHILAHAFKKDVDDPDRLGIQVDHIPFYYNKYFRKTLIPKDYGVDTCTELVKLVSDAVYLAPQAVLQSQLSEEMETFAVFAKVAEDARRIRTLRIDLGEDDAQLKLSHKVLTGEAGKGGKGGKKGDAKGNMKGVPPAGWTNPGQWENDLSASWGQWNVKGGAKGQMGKMGKDAMNMGAFCKGAAKMMGGLKGAVKGAPAVAAPGGAGVRPMATLKRPGEAAPAALPPMTNAPPAAPTPAPATAPAAAPQLVSPPGQGAFKGGFGGKDWGKGAGGKDWGKSGAGKDWGKGGCGKDAGKGFGGGCGGFGGGGGKDWGKGGFGGGKGGGKDQGWGTGGGGGKAWGKGGGKW